MAPPKNSDFKDRSIDLKHLIQSIQRVEGNLDCFGTADKNCDRMDCAWRELCLKKLQKSG